jgi:flagellin-like hook-associated protein FlgL
LGSHVLTIQDTSGNGTSGTVALNNGERFTWTATDTNLKVVGPLGEAVYIDTTSIAAGFDGEVDIEGQGSLSVDGGSSQVPVDFSDNQTIVHEITGRTLNVDSRAIRFAGTEPVEFPGTSDAITALLELKDDLLDTRGLGAAQLNRSFERRVADLDRISDHLLEIVGEQSVALQDLEQLTSQNDRMQLDLQSRLAELESADFPSIIVEMQSLQTTMQFNYAALSIVQANNLLDFLG